VALEEEGEVSEVSRRLYLRGAAGIVVSNLSAETEASAWYSAVKRRAIMTVDASGTTSSPAVSSHQLRSHHASATSASSHGPLIARLTRTVGGPSSFWAPGPSLPQEGALAGRAPGGYCRCSGYRGILVHLLLGLFIGPSSAQVGNDNRSYSRRPS
jgi:hypothetical protein